MREYINELNRCLSIVRWNPYQAITDMEFLKLEALENPIKEKSWNNTAKQINSFLDTFEKTRFYNKETFWKQHNSTRLGLI